MNNAANDRYSGNVTSLRPGQITRPPSGQPPLDPPGGPPHDSGMDPWQQTVESRLEALGTKLDTQLRWLLIAFASGFIVLGGLILNRTDALADKIDGVTEAVAGVKTDIAVLKAAPPSSAVTP